MRFVVLALGMLAATAAARPASAATIVVYTHPETLERRMVVVDPSGPDRIFMCMLPPGDAGCQQVAPRRAR